MLLYIHTYLHSHIHLYLVHLYTSLQSYTHMGRRGKNIRKRKVSSYNEARKKETNWWLLHGRFLIRMLYVALHLTELSSTPTIDYFMKNRVTLLGTIWNFLVDISWWFFWRGLSMDYIIYIYGLRLFSTSSNFPSPPDVRRKSNNPMKILLLSYLHSCLVIDWK